MTKTKTLYFLKLNSLLKNRYLWSSLAVSYLIIATFPGHYAPLQTGLDPSYVYGLNYLPNSNHILGRDVLFLTTYGPLGYILQPLNIGSNLIYSLMFRLLFHGLFAASLCYYVWKTKSVLPPLAFVATYLLATALGMEYEYHLLIIAALLICISHQNKKLRYITAPLCGVLAALFLFMKLSIGIAALSMIVISGTIWIIKKQQKALQVILITVPVYFLTLMVLSVVYLKSFQAFVGWLQASFNVTSDFSVAMSIVGPQEYLILALLSAGVYVAFLVLVQRQGSSSRYLAIAFALPIFFAFKHGFVRQDGHELHYIRFLLVIISVLILNALNTKELLLGLCSFALIFILSLPPANHYRVLTEASIINQFSGKNGQSNICSMAYLGATRNYLDYLGNSNLQSRRLPPEWVNLINNDHSTVDVLPGEISYCPANSLTWNPNPVVQNYAAYTSSLDNWSAKHYSDDHPPDFIIVEFSEIDGRNQVLSAPATWRTILLNYDVFRKAAETGLLLLKRKPMALPVAFQALHREEVLRNQWTPVPVSNNLLLVDIDMSPNLGGIIAKALFRIPPVDMDLTYESGKRISYRIIPATAKQGILTNYIPTTNEELGNLLVGVADDRVVKFRISGSGASYYAKTISLTWREAQSFKIAFTPKYTDSKTLPLAGTTLFSLDLMSANNEPILQQGSPIVIESETNSIIRIAGWAVDQLAKKEAGGVFMNIDGRLDIPAFYGLIRRDVADALNNSSYKLSGFSGTFGTSELDKGRHVLSFKVLTNDKKGYYKAGPEIIFDVR